MGFCEQIVKWMMALYTNASSAVLVNGEVGEFFPLSRSVRQGCPLAPFLFILVLDSLGYLLQSEEANVQGLILPNGTTLRDAEFADDTALYLKATEENLGKAQAVLKTYCQASGSEINWRKTYAIWASNRPRYLRWGEDFGLQWVTDGEGVRYLGQLVGFHLNTQANALPLIRSIKEKLTNWAAKNLSLAGRILVCNHLLLATCWYTSSSCGLDKKTCDIIRNLIRNYIWSGKDDSRARARVKWDACILPWT